MALKGRSEGSVRLGKLQDTQVQIARRIGVTQGLVSQWRSGLCKPGSDNRHALTAAYGIDFHAWDRPPTAPAAAVVAA